MFKIFVDVTAEGLESKLNDYVKQNRVRVVSFSYNFWETETEKQFSCAVHFA